jgi:hypothetical protein
MLVFEVVLEAIVRRAKLQTMVTIFSKQTHLAYADDIDIVGRNLEAVRDACLALEEEAAKVRLKIDEQETKYIIDAAGIRRRRTNCSF